MAHTRSWAFPNLFDVARSRVSILDDAESIVNRTKLLMLSEPTELYNSPLFGVGLKQHLFQYNTENQRAIILDRVKDQLRMFEPYVDADKTHAVKGLMFTEPNNSLANMQDINRLKMTIALSCVFGNTVEVQLNDEH